MISKWDMKNYIKKNPGKFPYAYKEEEDGLYDKETGEYLSSLDHLRLDVNIWKKEKLDDICSYWLKGFTIPLSWHQFYIQFIYRHLGKCHPSIRSKWYIGKAKEYQ